jgi:hypothetical protein
MPNAKKAARKTVKTVKTVARSAKTQPKRKLLSNAERSEVARLAAYKAHHHPTFMKLHASAAKNASTEDKKVTTAQYLRTLPSFNESLRD